MMMESNNYLEKMQRARFDGKTIGLVQGSWDLFHLGHLRYILEARKLCDYLIVAMDSDKKIQKRKGPGRPIIPEDERSEFIKLLNIADDVVVKRLGEPKWGLIRSIKPDVLIAIKENYTDEEIFELEKICGKVAILPRQSKSSTSEKIRQIMISGKPRYIRGMDEMVQKSIEEMKKRVGYQPNLPTPIPELFSMLSYSNDGKTPVAAACYLYDHWYYGVNQIDASIPSYDIENRTELCYATIEHAEINLLKKIGNVSQLNVPIWTTLFPCDKCMKVLIHKGVKKIFYIEDHPEKKWSKRSHELADKFGVETVQILKKDELVNPIDVSVDMNQYQYIYPPNARHQEQLDIMMNMENECKDPLDPNYINQEILFMTDYWYASPNRFPYEGVEQQFLIVARYPVYCVEDITFEMWNDLHQMWKRLMDEYHILGGGLCVRFGDPSRSGATLKRLHFHLILPKENNKTRFAIGGHKELKKGLSINAANESE